MAKSGKDYRRMTYIEGNAVRRLDVMPDNWEQEQKEREQREREQRQRRRRQRAIARNNQDRALIMNRGYVAFLTVAAVTVFLTAGVYIKLQSDVTFRMSRIAKLETEVNALKIDNEATEKRLATAVRMEDVKKQAVGKLGMTYPDKDQIVYYSIDHTDFMSQYDDIPQ